jgi:hypothetical protein
VAANECRTPADEREEPNIQQDNRDEQLDEREAASCALRQSVIGRCRIAAARPKPRAQTRVRGSSEFRLGVATPAKPRE